MVINVLTRWFNFEFGVSSHLNPVSIQPIAMLCMYILKIILFIPMVAPSSDQWRNSTLMFRWRHHSLRLGVVCTCPTKTMSSAWKCLPFPHFTNTYEAKKYSLKLRGFTCQISCILYQTPAVAASWRSNFRLGCSPAAQSCDATHSAHCFGCDHYSLKFI